MSRGSVYRIQDYYDLTNQKKCGKVPGLVIVESSRLVLASLEDELKKHGVMKLEIWKSGK